jgi:hypothetical protein
MKIGGFCLKLLKKMNFGKVMAAWKMKWLGHTGMVGAIPVWPPPYWLQKITKPLSLNQYGPHHTGMVGVIPVQKLTGMAQLVHHPD